MTFFCSGFLYNYRHPELDSGSRESYDPAMTKAGFTYILASQKRGTLYIGVTSDLVKRIYQHREGLSDGFTKEHKVKRLVYYECYDEISEAILREKKLKNWHRDWKISLVEEHNPEWLDLYHKLV